MFVVNKRITRYAWLVSIALVLTAVLPAYNGVAYAATSKLDNIRVALFIQTRDMAPAVTLSIPGTAQIGIRTPAGVRNWISVADGSPVRFSVDQYRVVLFESDNLHTAQSVAGQLSSSMNVRERAFVLGTERNGRSVYQVTAGNYTNLEEAVSARDRFLANSSLTQLLNGFQPRIRGPHHLSAGSFATEQEAGAILQLYQDRGIDAALVLHENANNELVYGVWIGEESSADQLVTLKSQAESAVPEFALEVSDAALPYLYKRTDYSGANPIAHYFYNSSDQRVWFSSSSPGIKVDERSGRTYRGSMELTQYNGRLALINELPFEQYLYAVVSNEMGGSFPAEALKAQAVAARTFALQQGMKYGIAHISDTTFDQAYYGYGSESPASVSAVEATASEVVVNSSDSSLITPFYSSNAGGFTSETDEVWGTAVPYLHSVPSPDDIAQEGRYTWYRIVTEDGQVGYIREDLVRQSGTTGSGLPILEVIDNNVNIRPSPDTSGTPVAQAQSGQRLTAIESVKESNPFHWITPMWTADSLLSRINQYVRTPISGELRSLEVTKRGMSGRVIEVTANGNQNLDVSYPDAFRTVFNSLRSTRFDIDQTNDITIQGAGGAAVNLAQSSGALYVLGGGSAANAGRLQSEYLFAMNAEKELRVGTTDARYRFVGRGFGHGLGMSQYGAMGLANVGYDYKQILQYYYKDVQIVKG